MKNYNNEQEFMSMYYGDFEPTDMDRRLYDLAKQYNDETEAYDKKVCSGRNERGIAIPLGGYQMHLISKNAHAVRKRLIQENPDVDPIELQKAIVKYSD